MFNNKRFFVYYSDFTSQALHPRLYTPDFTPRLYSPDSPCQTLLPNFTPLDFTPQTLLAKLYSPDFTP